MFFFRSRAATPSPLENGTRGEMIKNARVRLLAAKDELVDLPIPNTERMFFRIDDLLELCAKSKGDHAAIDTFVRLLTRFIDEALDPILKEIHRESKQRKTGALPVHIQTLFTELHNSIPAKRQLGGSSWDRIVHGADDVSAQLSIVNPKIEVALQNFKQHQNEPSQVVHPPGCTCILCENGVNELDLSGKIVFEERCNYGGYADVWRGKLVGQVMELPVAIKELRIKHSTLLGNATQIEERLKKRFMREVLLWKTLKHQNVVPLLGLSMDPRSSPTLISPWYHNGNIIQYLQSHPDVDRVSLALDTANGLTYLHSIPVVHGDLKGENVLVDARNRASLCDFGMSQFVDEAARISGFTTTSANTGGTDRYLCPELLEDGPKTTATDMWAFACLVGQILTDQIPYQVIKGKHAIPLAIIQGKQPMSNEDQSINENLWQSLTNCWKKAPGERPEAAELSSELGRLTQERLGDINSNFQPQATIQHVNSEVEDLRTSTLSISGFFVDPPPDVYQSVYGMVEDGELQNYTYGPTSEGEANDRSASLTRSHSDIRSLFDLYCQTTARRTGQTKGQSLWSRGSNLLKNKIEPIENTGEQGHEQNMTSADYVGRLFDQAGQLEVVLLTLSVASLLPPHYVFAAFNRRPGLLDRLAKLYGSYVEQRVRKRSNIPNPEETVVTGIALFHILKPHLRPNLDKVTLSLSKHRIRSHKECISDALPFNNKDLFKVFAIVICCIEMILPDSEGADASAFKECCKHISMARKFSSSITLSIPAPNIPNTSLTNLNLPVFPSGLLLDAVIASAVRHIRDDSWRTDWYRYYEIQELLKTLNNVLSDDPLEEAISHIAIVMAAVQLARRRPRPDQDIREKCLNKILEAWYIVDKRATVFTNTMLAFDMAGQIQREDNDTQQIYLALLRFLDDYLPKDMEVSKKTEWTTWWPKAMRLYPGVLGFLSQIDEKKIPLNDVLRVFARLLPDDWQYDYIREALLSQHTKETYPQVQALCPVIDNASPSAADSQATVIGLIIRSFKHRTGDIMAPPPIVQDSVVELLGWFVAYSGANDYLPAQVEAYEEYKYIPQFLVSVIKEKEDGPQSNIDSVGERNDMICRHAARHLLALAHMDSEKGTRASEVKLKSLIHVFQQWNSISHWTSESTSKIHPGRNFEGGLILRLVAMPLHRLRQVESAREGRAHHIRDSAFKEMMKVWRMAGGDVDSLERRLLLQERVVQAAVHYFEQHLDQQDLLSWESDVIDTAIGYIELTKQNINPDSRQLMERRLDDLLRGDQRRQSLFGWPS